MKTELIVSTYNNPRSLRLCIESIKLQSFRPDSICFADDGSGQETADIIREFAATWPVPVRHVWHADDGFQKCTILNAAISSSEADYIFFIDGDVMIHPDFLRRHHDLARPGQYLTGSLIRLDQTATDAVTPQMIRNLDVFTISWLRKNRALKDLSAWLKAMPFPLPVMAVFDRLSPVRPSLCGANSSAFRADLLRVNGYDEDMKYGGEDKELGVRLSNAGVKGRTLRYTAPLVHLEHARGYAKTEIIRKNRKVVKASRAQGTTWTSNGIKKDR